MAFNLFMITMEGPQSLSERTFLHKRESKYASTEKEALKTAEGICVYHGCRVTVIRIRLDNPTKTLVHVLNGGKLPFGETVVIQEYKGDGVGQRIRNHWQDMGVKPAKELQ